MTLPALIFFLWAKTPHAILLPTSLNFLQKLYDLLMEIFMREIAGAVHGLIPAVRSCTENRSSINFQFPIYFF
jgi:hypothetical protein